MLKVSDLSSQQEAQAFIEKLELNDRFLFKTSGSTGQPKELYFSKEQLKISASITANNFQLQQNSVLLCPLSLDYVAGKMMAVRAWYLKAELVYTGAVGNPFEIAGKRKMDFAAFVPLQLENMLKNQEAIPWLNAMQHIIVGGAAVSNSLLQAIQNQLSVPVYHTYGMTETLTHVAIKPLNGPEVSKHYHAMQGVALAVDKRNCLKVKSPVNQDWLQTNDVVELQGKSFEWLGRADFVINSAGFKIHPERVEVVVESLFGIQSMLIGVPDEKLGEKAVLVILERDAFPDLESLTTKLHPYEMPKEIKIIGDFPRLGNGKLDRKKLKSDLN